MAIPNDAGNQTRRSWIEPAQEVGDRLPVVPMPIAADENVVHFTNGGRLPPPAAWLESYTQHKGREVNECCENIEVVSQDQPLEIQLSNQEP